LINQLSIVIVADSSHWFEVDSMFNTKGLIASDAHTIAFLGNQCVDPEQSKL